MVKVLFVRHGETNYNIQGLCNSQGPEVYLTSKGITQAQELGLNLATENIDQVIVSPTFRTKETLKYLNLSLSSREDSRISELRTGFEGKPIKEYLSLVGDTIKGKLNGGESVEDLEVRIKAFMEDLKKFQNQTILVITHSMVMKVVKVIDQKLPLAEVDNMSLPKNGEVFTIIL